MTHLYKTYFAGKRSVAFSILLCSIIACSNKENNIISFDVDGSYQESGTFINKSSRSEYVFFAGRSFNPTLKIFDCCGNLQDSVSLQEAEREIGQISKVWMTSRDSIFAFSSNTQKYTIVNNAGTVVFTKEFGHKISDENGNCYDLYPPFMQNMDMRFCNSITYTTFWIANPLFDEKKSKTLTFITNNIRKGYLMYREKGDSVRLSKPFGVQMSNFTKLEAMQQYIFYPYYKTLNIGGRSFMLSHYSRCIYELDVDLRVINHFKIIPDSLPLARPILANGADNDYLLKEEQLDKQIGDNSFISNLLYNRVKNQFVAIIKTGNNEEDLFAYPLMIQIYDASFSKPLKTYRFDSCDYIPASSFILFDKLYIEKKSSVYDKREFEIIPL